jgi:hypothetical protein
MQESYLSEQGSNDLAAGRRGSLTGGHCPQSRRPQFPDSGDGQGPDHKEHRHDFEMNSHEHESNSICLSPWAL